MPKFTNVNFQDPNSLLDTLRKELLTDRPPSVIGVHP